MDFENEDRELQLQIEEIIKQERNEKKVKGKTKVEKVQVEKKVETRVETRVENLFDKQTRDYEESLKMDIEKEVQRIELERLEKERLEKERLETERLEKEKLVHNPTIEELRILRMKFYIGNK